MFFNFHLLPIISSLVSRQHPATHIVSSSIRNFSARYVLDFFCAKKFKYLSRRCWWKSSYVSINTSFCFTATISCYVWNLSYPSVPLCSILFYSAMNTNMCVCVCVCVCVWRPSIQRDVQIKQHHSCLKHHNFAWPVDWSYLNWTNCLCWTPFHLNI